MLVARPSQEPSLLPAFLPSFSSLQSVELSFHSHRLPNFPCEPSILQASGASFILASMLSFRLYSFSRMPLSFSFFSFLASSSCLFFSFSFLQLLPSAASFFFSFSFFGLHAFSSDASSSASSASSFSSELLLLQLHSASSSARMLLLLQLLQLSLQQEPLL